MPNCLSPNGDVSNTDSVNVDESVCLSNGCAVINDNDWDFGDIKTFEQTEQKSEKIDPH